VAELSDLSTVALYGASTACSYLMRLEIVSPVVAAELEALNEDIRSELENRPKRT
jgi:hypothetical protein